MIPILSNCRAINGLKDPPTDAIVPFCRRHLVHKSRGLECVYVSVCVCLGHISENCTIEGVSFCVLYM